jgi:hypothetical protein
MRSPSASGKPGGIHPLAADRVPPDHGLRASHGSANNTTRGSAAAKSNPETKAEQDGSKGQYGKHHILWIIPNYRSDESTSGFRPLTPRQKFKLAFDDSFDPTAFLVAGIFAGSSMAQRQYPSLGQGAEGFAKYYGGAFADQAIGNMLTEAILPGGSPPRPPLLHPSKGRFFETDRLRH